MRRALLLCSALFLASMLVGSTAPAVRAGDRASAAAAVETGYHSVRAMLRQDPFYIAHRGGSRDFPEMSGYAYAQSVKRGYGALEISVARTSDGVWFGLHDRYLDRTSLEDPDGTSLDPATMTWRQVRRHDISPWQTRDPHQPHRAYLRLGTLLKRYAEDHVLFVDPKYQTARLPALLNFLDRKVEDATKHIVIKYYGTADTVAGVARARGYTTWGFFYAGDDIAGHEAFWDLLGLNYKADRSVWDEVRSYGKPVIAHILPNRASRRTALAKGADGLVVSGVRRVHPKR